MSRKTEFLKKVERMLDPSIVSIDMEAISALEIGAIPQMSKEEPAPAFASTPTDVIHLALAINSINHQFWDVVDGKFERYSHEGKIGAIAMQAGVARLIEGFGGFDGAAAKLPLTEQNIVDAFGPIPDPAGRAEALGQALGPQGRAAATLLADSVAGGGRWDLEQAQMISTLLPAGFEDPLQKKSQLCLWMAKGMLEAKKMAAPDVELTCFADYQVPKVLRGMGILKYSSDLAAKVDAGELMEQDGKMEIALRAAAVIACEKISESKGISAPELDFWLWMKRNEFKEPFHRVKTRRY